MALSGHDSAALIINSTSTSTTYSGTVTGVTSGNLYVVTVEACGNSGTNDPSGWTVTIGSDTLTYQSGQSASGVFGFTGIFTGVATGSGNLTLSITTSVSCRSLAAHVFDITGFDATTPIPNAGQGDSHSSNTNSLTVPNAVTTAANGNAIIGCVSVKGGDITNLAVGAADGSTTGQTGGNASNDNEWGVAWDETPTAASVTFAWTWTGNDRPGAAWIEVAEATGGAGTDALTADDVESSSEVSSPNIGQSHALNASDVESASEVSAPVLGQIHALTADDVESASEVTAPTLTELTGGVDALAADDIESASSVSAPVVGQIHALAADDVESASEVSAPALGVVHVLLANDVESASETTSPALGQNHALNANDVQSVSQVSAPVIIQIHGLTAVSIEAASVVSNPNLYDGDISARRSASPGASATGGTFTRSGTGGLITRNVKSGSII